MSVIDIHCRVREPGPHPANRRCSHPACITILNRWHEGELCYQHAPAKPATLHEQRTAFEDLMSEAA